MTAFNQIQNHIRDGKDFVLQGGAGSGKTESLKQLLEFISAEYPNKNIACITHTNLAANEIKSRVGDQYTISTIHSFLNSIIKNHKKNIHSIIYELFKLEKIVRKDVSVYESETEQKKSEHENYKNLHKKYANRLHTVKKEAYFKVEGKREYDSTPEHFNKVLNDRIDVLNSEMIEEIKNKDYLKIEYNETRFNDYHDLTYGHDGVIDISYLLFEKYEMLGKILQDKYDFIFIDEYQDTNEKIVDIFLKLLPIKNKTLIGLFGDSMQAIYDDGIGDVEKQVTAGELIKVNKEDNYRCSVQVVDFINKLRNDGLSQEVAFKTNNGITETISDRQGSVTLYYSVYPSKPHARSTPQEKAAYSEALNTLISKALDCPEKYRQLKLTNKSIASDIGFEKLYDIFSDRFLEPQEYMDKHLSRLQFSDLYELYNAYTNRNYNFVLSNLKKQKFALKELSDKDLLKQKFDKIINSTESAAKVIAEAFKLQLIKKSEKYDNYLVEREAFLKSLSDDVQYQNLKGFYNKGGNTFIRMQEFISGIEEEDFNEFDRALKKENFYIDLFSEELKFNEIIKYYEYINDETKYITMHKTKGSGIENVLVVLEEYFWHAYNFKEVFSSANDNPERKLKNTKLVYVAASRAKQNLKCVKLISADEETDLLNYFSNVVKL